MNCEQPSTASKFPCICQPTSADGMVFPSNLWNKLTESGWSHLSYVAIACYSLAASHFTRPCQFPGNKKHPTNDLIPTYKSHQVAIDGSWRGTQVVGCTRFLRQRWSTKHCKAVAAPVVPERDGVSNAPRWVSPIWSSSRSGIIW